MAKPPAGRSGEPSGSDRLQKVLAHAGVGSRRACEEMILQGRVSVGGQVVRELGTKVDPARQAVAVDGQKVQLERPVYFAVYKPKGYVSTNDDPSGRPRVLDLLPEIPQRVYTIGRLDEMSVGLMLLTNDGDLANKLAHPRYGVEKLYRVAVAGSPTREVLSQLTEGIWLAEGKVRAKRVRAIGKRGESTILELVLAEGKNREVRRMLAKLGHKVMTLTRVAVGPITTKGLTAGQFRPLTGREVDLLRRVAAGQSVPMPWMEDRKPRRLPERPHRPEGAGPAPYRPGLGGPAGSPTPPPRFADGRRLGSGSGPRPPGRPGQGQGDGPRPQGRPGEGYRPGPRAQDRPAEGYRPGPRAQDRPGEGRRPGPRPQGHHGGPPGGQRDQGGQPPRLPGGQRGYLAEGNRPSNRPGYQGPRPNEGPQGPSNRPGYQGPRPNEGAHGPSNRQGDDRRPGPRHQAGPPSRQGPAQGRGPRPAGSGPMVPRRPVSPPSLEPPGRKVIGMGPEPVSARDDPPASSRDDRPKPRMKRLAGPGKRPAPRHPLGSRPKPKRRGDGGGPSE